MRTIIKQEQVEKRNCETYDEAFLTIWGAFENDEVQLGIPRNADYPFSVVGTNLSHLKKTIGVHHLKKNTTFKVAPMEIEGVPHRLLIKNTGTDSINVLLQKSDFEGHTLITEIESITIPISEWIVIEIITFTKEENCLYEKYYGSAAWNAINAWEYEKNKVTILSIHKGFRELHIKKDK